MARTRRLGAGLNKVKAETAISVLAYNILRAINLVGASGLRAAAAKAQSDQLQVDIKLPYFATCSRSSAGTRKLGKKITRGENKTCGRTVTAGNVVRSAQRAQGEASLRFLTGRPRLARKGWQLPTCRWSWHRRCKSWPHPHRSRRRQGVAALPGAGAASSCADGQSGRRDPSRASAPRRCGRGLVHVRTRQG